MILNKKGFVMLPLAALLFATGCAKNISLDDAKKFVRENYTSTTEKTTKKVVTDIVGHASNDDARALLKEEMPMLDDNLKYHKESTKSEDQQKYLPIKEGDLDEYGDIATFTLNGKALSMKVTIEVSEGEYKISSTQFGEVTSEGYPCKGKQEISYKTPKFNYGYTITFTYEY